MAIPWCTSAPATPSTRRTSARPCRARGATRLLVTGCATDFCVDTTIRAAASLDYDVVVVEDGHTTADRPHVDALSVMRHHNWVWQNLIHPRTQIRVIPAGDVVALIQPGPRGADRVDSMILSVRPSTEGGMARPRAFAVLRFTTSSSLVGSSTGRSASLAFLRSPVRVGGAGAPAPPSARAG